MNWTIVRGGRTADYNLVEPITLRTYEWQKVSRHGPPKYSDPCYALTSNLEYWIERNCK